MPDNRFSRFTLNVEHLISEGGIGRTITLIDVGTTISRTIAGAAHSNMV